MVRKEVVKLLDIPNIGKSIEKDLALLGIKEPLDLVNKDPYQMYGDLCMLTGQKYDPCIIDVFISAVRYMEGGPARKWWEFTNERKKKMASL